MNAKASRNTLQLQRGGGAGQGQCQEEAVRGIGVRVFLNFWQVEQRQVPQEGAGSEHQRQQAAPFATAFIFQYFVARLLLLPLAIYSQRATRASRW